MNYNKTFGKRIIGGNAVQYDKQQSLGMEK